MENPEEVLQLLERFTKLKQKEIPRELDDYLGFVARTGDTVYRWAIVKHLFREKLVHVITDFHDNTPSIADLPQCPNVDPFNYERMKRILLERLDAFNSAPFTVQRICELLTEPRKQYTRIDKFMRAVEKNILVVSTQEPGRRRSDSENGDSLDSIVNGDLEVNVDIEMDNEAAAFGGIDAGAVDVVPPVTTTAESASVPVPEEESAPVAVAAVAAGDERSCLAEPEVSKEEAVVAETDGGEVAEAATEPATTMVEKVDEVKEQGLGDEPATVTPSTDDIPIEADLPKEDSKSTVAENHAPTDDQLAVVAQPIEEPPPQPSTTVEDLPIPAEEQAIAPLEPTTETNTASTSTEPLPSKESHELATDQNLPDAAAQPVESADDGQPAPKQAKLCEEPLEVAPVVAAAPVSVPLEVEAEKDDVSSGSTTDSGGSGSSSTSVESEPTPAVAVQEEQQESFPEEPSATTTTTTPDEVTPEIPPVVEPELIPEQVKELPPVEEAAAGVEMETAVVAPSAPVLIPESVMATDEEDTIIQSPVDAPMAADVPEVVKPDDNAMDVDESSVEPMEDQ